MGSALICLLGAGQTPRSLLFLGAVVVISLSAPVHAFVSSTSQTTSLLQQRNAAAAVGATAKNRLYMTSLLPQEAGTPWDGGADTEHLLDSLFSASIHQHIGSSTRSSNRTHTTVGRSFFFRHQKQQQPG